ncbi:hypothetical protein R3P38DRAFT_2815408 [Favolaschia claudopus]|uniref:Uncharacterized protein n=1 Tax=Favolaschia claudopus TaxID=2862362 RepID=A0AAV9Z1D6_9AGAR
MGSSAICSPLRSVYKNVLTRRVRIATIILRCWCGSGVAARLEEEFTGSTLIALLGSRVAMAVLFAIEYTVLLVEIVADDSQNLDTMNVVTTRLRVEASQAVFSGQCLKSTVISPPKQQLGGIGPNAERRVQLLDDLPDISFVSTVNIYVQCLEDSDNVNALVRYNVDLLQPIRKLKTDIEEIEGIRAVISRSRAIDCISQKGSASNAQPWFFGVLRRAKAKCMHLQMDCVWKLEEMFLCSRLAGSTADWHYATCGNDLSHGWIPRSFVRQIFVFTAMFKSNSQSLDLVPFKAWMTPLSPSPCQRSPFPLAEHLRFKLRLGEKGHSYVDIALRYERTAPPGEATPIEVQLNCVSAGDRKITSVSLKIIAPGANVARVHCPDTTTLGSINSVTVQSTSRQTWNQHGGINITIPHTPLGIDAGVSKKTQYTQKEEGTRESGLTVTGVHNADTAHWIVEGGRGVGEREGVPKVLEGMSFVLQEKPSEFQYECFVTTTKGGREVEHWGQSVGIFERVKRLVL